MTKIEKLFCDFLKNHIIIIMIAAATALGIVMRVCGISFESGDFKSFLNPWWDIIKNGGASILSDQVGNYNIPYQIITYLLTLLPLTSLQAYKLISIIFDFVLAVSAALIVYQAGEKQKRFAPALTYALTFCSLPVVFNSAFWAQCDSIYVAFILLAIYFEMRNKHIPAFILLGISLSFKLQMIFILPVFLYYYISTRRVSILHFLLIPAADIVMCLPAVFMGRNPLDIVKIYVTQTDYGKLIQMNCPNIYAFMCDGMDMNNYYLLKTFSIILTILILGIGLCMIIRRDVDLSDCQSFMFTAAWTSFTCLMFLSSMHERYGYLLDALLIIYVIMARKHYWIAVACNLVSLRGYGNYLFKYEVVDIKLTSVIYIGIYVYVSYLFVKEVILQGNAKKTLAKQKG